MKKLLIFIICISVFVGCNTVADKTSSIPTVTVDYADDNLDNTVRFVDGTAVYTNYDLAFSTDTAVKNFMLLEMDESEALQIKSTLWCLDELTPEKPAVISTYLNDATINRGISYIDQNGEEFIFSIVVSMADGSISLGEFKE